MEEHDELGVKCSKNLLTASQRMPCKDGALNSRFDSLLYSKYETIVNEIEKEVGGNKKIGWLMEKINISWTSALVRPDGAASPVDPWSASWK